MSTAFLTQTDTSALLSMSPEETSKTVAQMTALMNAMASEKDNIDSMAAMLEKQPWYKKMWFTISGKNKATVKEIQQSKDKLTAYTANALAELYKNSRIEQAQIIAVGQAVNSVNSQLAATNYELIKTQEAFAEFKAEIIDTIGSLANALNEKIKSIDNYHSLIEEIALGKFDSENIIAIIFGIISQIDKRTAEDSRKMENIHIAMSKQGYLNDNELPITEYMNCVAKLPDNVVGTIYYEFSCLNGNDYAEMFCEVIENYSMLPKMEKKSKKLDVIINGILESHNVDSDTEFSTNEIYDYFIEGKKDYLLNIGNIAIEIGSDEQDIADTAVDNVESEKSSFIPEIEKKELIIIEPQTIGAGEIKTYENLNIHLKSVIECAGEIQFINCSISYLEDDIIGGILLKERSTIKMVDSVVYKKGKKTDYFSDDSMSNPLFTFSFYISTSIPFIKSEGTLGVNVKLTNCQFYDCFEFIDIETANELDIEKCEIVNCSDKFIHVKGVNYQLDICNNLILNDSIAYFNRDHSENGATWQMFFFEFRNSDSKGRFIDNTVINTEKFEKEMYGERFNFSKYYDYKTRMELIDSIKEVRNCTFIGQNRIICSPASLVTNCRFIRCYMPLHYSSLGKGKYEVSDNVFINCSDIIWANCTAIKHCQFIDCKERLIETSSYGGALIEDCQFYNSTYTNDDYYASLYFERYKGEQNKLVNCTFDGVDVKSRFLVMAGRASDEHIPSEVKLYIDNCSFRNCHTGRDSGNILLTTVWYKVLFSDKWFDGVIVNNCNGLNNVNKEKNHTSNYTIKTKGTDGKIIGSEATKDLDEAGIIEKFVSQKE